MRVLLTKNGPVQFIERSFYRSIDLSCVIEVKTGKTLVFSRSSKIEMAGAGAAHHRVMVVLPSTGVCAVLAAPLDL